MTTRCRCHIIPEDVLQGLSRNKTLSLAKRKVFADTVRLDREIRRLRSQATRVSQVMRSVVGAPPGEGFAPPLPPAVTVFSCGSGEALPGALQEDAAGSVDARVVRVFDQTTKLSNFYLQMFGRSSVDGAGAALLSSVHYGSNYQNAFWTGSEMAYGDGDGEYLTDFTEAADVIAHEITHGITQHSLQLNYEGESGGLNESLSDCFGAMFRQFCLVQDAGQADWLIGPDVIGPAYKALGKTCVRDMETPGAEHCVTPQIASYGGLTPNLDPHYASGPPNLAFCTACKTAGGNSWEGVGKVWYQAMNSLGPNPTLTMSAFADATRRLAREVFPDPASLIPSAVDQGWAAAGL